MPIQKSKTKENKPISFRPGAIQLDRLKQLAKLRQQNKTAIINAALDLLWLLDIGYKNLEVGIDE